MNAEKVRLTGNKAEQKTYFRHSGYMGGERHIPFKRMQERKPEWIIRREWNCRFSPWEPEFEVVFFVERTLQQLLRETEHAVQGRA